MPRGAGNYSCFARPSYFLFNVYLTIDVMHVINRACEQKRFVMYFLPEFITHALCNMKCSLFNYFEMSLNPTHGVIT